MPIVNGSFEGATNLIVHLIFMTADDALILACMCSLLYVTEVEEYVNQVIWMDRVLSG